MATAVKPRFAEASKTLLRDTVLDAVHELLEDRPWAEVTMGEVGERAGVSRQTLYNTFGARDELSQAYVIREADRFLDIVAETVRANEHDPRAALSAALGIFLSAAATHPLVRAIASPQDSDELLALVTVSGGPVLGGVTSGLARVIAQSWPALAVPETHCLADCLVRLAISHAALPGASPHQTADKVAEILGPYLDGLLEGR
ncbi:MAG: TetR family transcriptional regulator [Actinomycetota bacterium]|nr:TetR family transcriptional regulator [Actinomycetota bacterium]